MKPSAGKAQPRRSKYTPAQMADKIREDGIWCSEPTPSISPLWSEFERLINALFGALSENRHQRPLAAQDELGDDAVASIPHLLKAHGRLGALIRLLAQEDVPRNQLALHHLIKQTERNIEQIHGAKARRVAVFACDMIHFPVLVSNPPNDAVLNEQLCRVEVGSLISKQDTLTRRKRDLCADVARVVLHAYKAEQDDLNEVSRDTWPSLRKKISAMIQLKSCRHDAWYKEIAKTISIRGKNRTTGRVESKMKDKILNRIYAMLGLGAKVA